jgi:hypothetical protein
MLEVAKMTKSKLQAILESTVDGVRSYSGRAMYGRSCLGVETNDVGDLFAAVLEEVEGDDDTHEIQEAFRDMRTDAMGRGTIVYFPNVEFVGDEDEHECEGPSCCTAATV